MSFDAIEYINSPKRNISKPGLERINLLCNLLGNPQNFLKFIHVAGTNGKGSVCAYLTQILINAGVRVGTFTSPFI
jgi:dihydrofolate synthase / folylpolyglutamate synthase